MDLKDAAYNLAIAHVQPDVDRGYSVESIQATWHGSGGPEYHVDIIPGYRVHVTKVNGRDCDYYFPLRKIYAECLKRQGGQTALF